jgi:ribulose-5-phosphate 4-epimerase/fuculose-1-phosphate aldolase
MNEIKMREKMTMHARSLFERGYTAGGSGNISVRLKDGILLTPTNSCFGRLEPERIAKLDMDGNHLSGDKPSKEGILHLSIYKAREQDTAIVHLHSTYAAALSCLEDADPLNMIPPITPYFVMRIGKLPLVPYYPPGDPRLAKAVGVMAVENRAVLMAQHGAVVAGKDIDSAVYASEELEESAKLYLILKNLRYSILSKKEVETLKSRFAS